VNKPDASMYDRAVAVLRGSELFRRFDDPFLRELLPFFHRETWAKDSVVMGPEETVKKFYVLISGRVRVTRMNADTGRRLNIFLLGPGDGFDVVPLLDGKPHDVMVMSLDELEAISAPVSTFHGWIEKHPDFNKSLLPYVGKQLRKLTDLASDLALCDTGTRLMKLFLEHTVQANPKTRLRLIHDLPQEELASMIGTVREVVNRYLHNLRKEGIIVDHKGEVEIKDLHGLIEKIEKHL
jgi:CRP/FNR family cyclic AMP-dependent transcriptional regulator